MMGLLDNLDDPKTQAILSMGFGLLNSRGNLGQGLGQAGPQALQAFQQAKQAQQQKAMQAQQMEAQQQQLQMQRQAMEAQQAQRQRQSAIEAAYRGAFRSPDQVAMAANGGPTMAAAQAAPSAEPMIDQQALLRSLSQVDPVSAYQMMQPKPEDMKVVGDALIGVAGGKARELYRAPEKAPAMPTSIQEFLYAKGNPEFSQWDLSRKKASGTQITLPKIDIKTGESIGAQVGPMLRESRDKAVAGVKLVDSANRILSAAERGGLFAGPGANLLMKGAQVADVFGIAGKDTKEKISNTRSVIRGMAEQAVAARSQLGGQAQISNSEQELLNKATSGDIAELTAGEIVQIAKLNDRLGRQLYASHDDVMNTVKGRPDLQSTEPFYRAPKMPEAYKPAAKLDVISEADRILNGGR